MYTFPSPKTSTERFLKWLAASGNINLLNITNDKIIGRCICECHFDRKYFLATRLSKTAIPTLNVPNPIDVSTYAIESEGQTWKKQSSLMDVRAPTPEMLKRIVTELKEPALFRRMFRDLHGEHIWKLFDWSLDQLAEKFQDMKLPFRVGYNKHTAEPQWDVDCSFKVMTLREFLDIAKTSCDEWYYFDYKYIHEWFRDNQELSTSFNWSRFGFDQGALDSTIWIGSKGAHTNCHRDSYGCNLVTQVHGRKEWLLLPPDTDSGICPTRIPYEESTIYSKLNFFSPTKQEEEAIVNLRKRARVVTMEPGDVLFVPGGWWHYVESLETSLSVNVWLPLNTDCQARLKEALVKLIVCRVGKGIPMAANEEHCTLLDSMKLIEASLRECRATSSNRSEETSCTIWNLLEKYPLHVKLLGELDESQLRKYISEKGSRFPTSGDFEKTEDSSERPPDALTNVVNAFCQPDIIDRVADVLLNNVKA